MAKSSSLYICQQCSYETSKWMGKCPECGIWNSLVETVISTRSKIKNQKSKLINSKAIINLSSIKSSSINRITTKISELDRVLGGGLVSGQVVLIAGEPGIGKSTLLTQLAGNMGNNKSVLYVAGEESAYQIKIRTERLKVIDKNINIIEETDVDQVIERVSSVSKVSNVSRVGKTPDIHDTSLIIVDSIQTMFTSDLSGMAGSVGQVRECTYRLVRTAKEQNIPIIIVGHVTKEGTVAGPSVLMHLVDTVLWFEGDKNLQFRMLRAIKNRFGPTDEVGIFTMDERGLISQDDLKGLFGIQDDANMPGRTISGIMEGTRPVLVEIQSLVSPTKMAFPKRIAQGIDSKRYEILIAVLSKICGIPLYEFDCFTSVTGGISVRDDTSSDLAICLSLASSYLSKALPNKSIAIGEVDLLGNIRNVAFEERRIKEAKRMGYKTIISSNETKSIKEVIRGYLK